VELVGPDAVGPDAGRVDHVGGADLELAAAERVAAEHAGGAAVTLDQAGRLDGVRADRAVALGLAEDRQRQPDVVGLAVVEEVGGRRAARREGGQQSQRLVGVDGAVAVGAPRLLVGAAPAAAVLAAAQAAIGGHHVVHVQPDAHRAIGAAAVEGWDQQRQRADEVRRQVDQQLALQQRLANQAEVEVLQVAQAAVDELAGPAGGARGPVALLEQTDVETPAGGVERGTGAGDPAADDEDVEGLAGHAVERVAAVLR
jgi:hypothetical protein